MELLPIIYVSLAIFAVVAVATIITSFVSYKIREKTEGYKKPYEKEEDPSNQNYMKKKIMDADGKFHTVISGENNKTDKNQKRHHSRNVKEKRKETHRSERKTNAPQSRIKIINNPSKLELPPLPVKEMKEEPKKNSKKINENILESYTEDKKEEFYTPKITVKKKEDNN